MSNIDKSLKRYKVLDTCLRDASRQWTLQDLLARCSEVDLLNKVGLRTIQMDLQYLRNTYLAPIEVYQGKYYKYSSAAFSIFKLVPTGHELDKINKALEVLLSLSDFAVFSNLKYEIHKLEYKVQHYLSPTEMKFLSGADTASPFIGEIVDYISRRQSTVLSYTKNGQQVRVVYCPYLLKEYENHLYVCGWDLERQKIKAVAVSSIEDLRPSKELFHQDPAFDESYFENVIGVHRKLGDQPIVLHLLLHPDYSEEFMQNPIHHSQQTISVQPLGTKIAIKVIWNEALEARILSYGPKILVLAPKEFRKRILTAVKKTKKEYEKD